MQRVLGILLIALAAAGVVAQMAFGLHVYVGDVLHAVLGPYVTDTFSSPIGAATVYGFFYFLAACGLVLLAIAKRVRTTK